MEHALPKITPRVEAIGTVDELNSAIGTVLAYDIPKSIRECLKKIQRDLFDLGAELCIPEHTILSEQKNPISGKYFRSFG